MSEHIGAATLRKYEKVETFIYDLLVDGHTAEAKIRFVDDKFDRYEWGGEIRGIDVLYLQQWVLQKIKELENERQ